MPPPLHVLYFSPTCFRGFVISVSSNDQKALAEAGLLGVSRSKNGVEVLTSEDKGDSSDSDNNDPEYGGTDIVTKRELGEPSAGGVADDGSDELANRRPRTRAAVGRGADVSRYAAEDEEETLGESQSTSLDSQSTIDNDLV